MPIDPRIEQSKARAGPIVSQFADDADMVELVELFVSEMPAKVEALTASLRGEQFSDLKRLAHQLKGACGGYGFPDVGNVAGALEHKLMKISQTPSESELNDLRRNVDDLIDLCRRVSVR